MPGPKPSLTPVAQRFLFAVIGAAIFLTINFFLAVSRCTTNEFMINCGGSVGRDTALVIFMTAIVGLVAFLGARGRGFAEGFFGSLVALGILTTGSCTPSWIDPYWSVRRTIRPYQDRWEQDRRNTDMRRAWIDALNARPMDVRRAVTIAGGVVSCAVRPDGSIIQTEAEIAEFCQALRNRRTTIDPASPLRYLIPPANEPDVHGGLSVPEENGDSGWRIKYTATPEAFAVDAEPDELLAHRWPRVRIDSAGRVEARLAENATPVAISPVDDLRAMAVCLEGIPAEEERRRAKGGGVWYGWFLTSLTRQLCPGLSPRLQALVPNDENTTRLTVLVPASNGTPPVAVFYKVQFVRRATAAFEFDLVADAMAAGLPHFLATIEGQVHTTMDRRSATRTDSIVP